MKIERDKWYLTRSGEKVRVVCTDSANPKYPIIALCGADGIMWAHEYAAEGSFYHKDDEPGEHRHDLVSEYVEPPKPKELWVRKYENGDFGASTWEDPTEAEELNGSKLVLFREVIE